MYTETWAGADTVRAIPRKSATRHPSFMSVLRPNVEPGALDHGNGQPVKHFYSGHYRHSANSPMTLQWDSRNHFTSEPGTHSSKAVRGEARPPLTLRATMHRSLQRPPTDRLNRQPSIDRVTAARGPWGTPGLIDKNQLCTFPAEYWDHFGA